MIIENICLHNVGVYVGKHSVDLAPTSKDKNIILIGGLNGVGKTTLLESLQIVLFGRLAPCIKEAKGIGYDAYLRKLISRSVKENEGSSITLIFITHQRGEEVRYKIVRSWVVTKSRLNECVSVYVDGQYDPVLSESWYEEVERFVSPHLSHLFFFDGEKIKSLANPETSANILRSAISSLLGMDLVDQLKDDLSILIRRKQKEDIPESSKTVVGTLEIKLKTIVDELIKLKQQRADLFAEFDHLNLKKEKLDRSFSEKGGELYNQRQSLEDKLNSLNAELRSNQQTLIQYSTGALPLSLLAGMLDDVERLGKTESESKRNLMVVEAFVDRDQQLLSVLSSNTKDQKLVNKLEIFLKKGRDNLREVSKVDSYLEMDERTLHQISILKEEVLPSALEAVSDLIKKNATLNLRIDNAERQLEKVPDDVVIRDLLQKIDNTNNAIKLITNTLQDVEAQITLFKGRREQVISDLDLELRSVEEGEIIKQENLRLINHSKQVQNVMVKFKSQVMRKHTRHLEVLIADAFKTLLRKHSLVKSIKINPNECTLTLVNDQNQIIEMDQLSAGERQLLATSILWGLGQASGSKLPVIIDTPLGRLDSKHREHLLTRYFPNASHQVILLSTDEEIDTDAKALLSDKIGCHYLLDFDESTRSTSIKQGYFGGVTGVN